MNVEPPHILIIDDLFGRRVVSGRNRERENLCAKFLLLDAEQSEGPGQFRVETPTAIATFYRGQIPAAARVGSVVENDLEGSLSLVRQRSGKGGKAPWSLILVDLCFYTGLVTEESDAEGPGVPEGRSGDEDPAHYFGLTLLEAIHRQFPHLPVMVLSSKPRDEVSREFSERGAVGFIARDDPRGAEALQDALWRHGLIADESGKLLGSSLALLLALREARRLAREDRHIIIEGEAGTPRAELASYISEVTMKAGERLRRPYVFIGSGALATSSPAEFLGSDERSPSHPEGNAGFFEAANGGDLVLDEVTAVPRDIQGVLLRVLQEQQVQRLGGRRPRSVRIRVIVIATTPPSTGALTPELAEELRSWNLLRMPPLCERLEDFPMLAKEALRVAEMGRVDTFRREMTPAALARLADYSWPGNEAELAQVINSAVSRYPDVEFLVPGHLNLGESLPQPAATLETDSQPFADSDLELRDLLKAQSNLLFSQGRVVEWAGQLEALRLSQSWVQARLLAAALEATKRRTPSNPAGTIQIQPALRLAMGDPLLTASKAADLVKRLLAPIANGLTGDLADAYAAALRLRPKDGGRRNGHQEAEEKP
jgi:two-component system response regulator FlrC